MDKQIETTTAYIEAQKIKLTPVQNKVVWCLQNGYSLLTSSDVKGALVARLKPNDEFHIHGGVFWKLEKLGLIRQGFERQNFDFGLTELGESIKTKSPFKT